MRLVEKLAQDLMQGVYYPFSVCVALNAEGKICFVKQFDTVFGSVPRLEGGIDQVLLLSNHPDGDMRPSPWDQKHLRLLKESARCTVRLIIVSEDNGWKEIE